RAPGSLSIPPPPPLDRPARLLAPLPANHVGVYGPRSPRADAHRHRPENLLSREADRRHHAWPWHPYSAPLLCDASAGSGRRCPHDPDVAGASGARYHHPVSPDHPPASGDDPQPVRPPALRGPTSAHVGVAPCHRIPTPVQMRQPSASPAPHRGKLPISFASMGSDTAVRIPSRLRISR